MSLSVWIAIGSLIVAIFSLGLSAFGIYRTLDRIEIQWHESVIKPNPIDLLVTDRVSIVKPTLKKMREVSTKSKDEKNDAEFGITLQDALIIQITIVNYGTAEMGYFQLQVEDNNGNILPILTDEQLDRQEAKYLLQKSEKHSWVPITIPHALNGVIPSHSFSMWNVVVTNADPKTTWLKAEIALTKKRWFKPWSKAYEGHTAVYQLPESLIFSNDDEEENDTNE